jgi:VCBS repeat-containing protein
VLFTVNPVNDAPTVANAITDVTVAEDAAPTIIDISSVFADVDIATNADSLSYSVVSSDGTLVNASISGTNLTLTYVAEQSGTATITVTATDANGPLAVSDPFTVTVTAVNDVAVIGGVDTGVVTEDVDPDLDNLLEVSGALTIIDPDTGEAAFNAGVIGGTYGVVTLNAVGGWDYAANTNQVAIQSLAAGASLTDTITISSVDGTSHDIVITIMGTNDVPVAGNDVATVNEGGSVVINVATTDSDIDNAIDLNSIIITGLPTNGTVVVNGDGTVTYNHNGSETISDSFTYTISDISGAVSNSASVSVTVNPVNDAPVATDDVTSVAEGNIVVIDLAVNDSDVDNVLDLNSIMIISSPVNGLLGVNGDGTVTYTHDGSNTISDSFTYTISDISGAISNTATVNITVTPVNNVPITSGIASFTVNEDEANTGIDLNTAFADSDNLDSELTYSIVGNTNIGLFSVAGIDNTTGQLTLDYAADMNGATQISIRATDPSGASVDTMFTVTITPVNDSPVLVANAGANALGTSNTVILNSELSVDDVDNADAGIVYTVTELPTNGQLLVNGVAVTLNGNFTEADIINNNVSYQADGSAVNDQFAFSVTDGAGGTISGNAFDIVVSLAPPEPEEPPTIIDPAPQPDPVITPEPDDTEQAEVTTESVLDRDLDGLSTGGSGRTIQQPTLTLEPTTRIELEQADPVNFNYYDQKLDTNDRTEINFSTVSTIADIQVRSIKALWTAIDQMKQEMDDNVAKNMTDLEFRAAAVESSGVALTAGVVAWVLRSGALMTSLISTIPLWKGYDPLPILAYKDDDDEQEKIAEDKIPTSLEELKKIKAIKEKMNKYNKVDNLFGGSEVEG